MLRPLPALCIAVLLSVAASLTVTTILSTPAPLAPVSLQQESSVNSAEIDQMREELRDLRLLVETLEQRLSTSRRQPVTVEPSAVEGGPAQASNLLASSDSERSVFKDQVVQVLTEIEEAEEAEKRLKEVEESNAEYDVIEETLDERLVGLQTKLGLAAGQASDLGSLLAVQNERNREMTRLWSEGVSKEELDQRFAEYRATHRREVMALLGPDQMNGYRRMLRNGHLGGRFSFFVGPWEDWANPK